MSSVLAGKPRRPIVAVLLSAVACPGVGQVYNGERNKGVAMIVLSVAAGLVETVIATRNVLAALPEDVLILNPGDLMAIIKEARSGPLVSWCSAVFAVTWVVSVIDAYFGARRPAPETRISL
jgi:hypothetical protein